MNAQIVPFWRKIPLGACFDHIFQNCSAIGMYSVLDVGVVFVVVVVVVVGVVVVYIWQHRSDVELCLSSVPCSHTNIKRI